MKIYDKIADFTYKDGYISEYEAALLVSLLQRINNNDLLPERIDEIMINADTRKFKEISVEIINLKEGKRAQVMNWQSNL